MTQNYSTFTKQFLRILIAFKSYNAIASYCLLLMSFVSFGQLQLAPAAAPSNDNFNNAQLIQVSNTANCSTSVSGTTRDATGQSGIPSCYTNNVDDDVWYKFVALYTSHNINVTPNSGTQLKGASFQVLSGSWGSLTNIHCAFQSSSTTTNPIQANVTNLEPGKTYYIRVFSRQNNSSRRGNFSICVTSSFCEPATSGTGNPTRYITKVESLGAIDNNSNTSGRSSYSDFSSVDMASQIPGQPINLKITVNTDGGLSYHIFVDWNKNGVFDNPAEMVVTTADTYLGSTTLGFSVPQNTLPGKYLVRIKTATSSTNNPCTVNNGETEDYTITVLADCSAKITKVFNAERCGAGEVLLKVEATPGTTSYNWYNEYSFGIDQPIETTTVPQLARNLSTTTRFRVTAVNGNCESRVKTTITGFIRPLPTITFEPENPTICGEDNIIKVTANASSNKAVAFEQDFSNSPFGSGPNTFVPVVTTGPSITSSPWRVQTSTHLVDYTSGWRPAISSGDSANKFLMTHSNNVAFASNYTTTILETKPFNTVGFEDLTLEYKQYFSQNSVPSARARVEVKIGNGVWIQLSETLTDTGFPSKFEPEAIDLSTYVGQTTVRIRFLYTAKWADGWALDDVVISGQKETIPNFTWGSGVSAFVDENATIPYTNQQISTLYIKPSQEQMESASFLVEAGISVGAGLCEATNTLSVTNKSKIWSPVLGSTNWHNNDNWRPAGAPTLENCVIVPNGVASIGNPTTAFGKNLSIKAAGKVIVTSKASLVIDQNIDSPYSPGNPALIVEDDASIRQIANVANSGTTHVKRITEPVRRYDYTYWSSMVDNQTLANLSPATLADKFHFWNSPGDSWTTVMSGNLNMEAAKGYIIRAPQHYDILNAQNYTADFKGKLNNGDYSQILYEDKWALLGNPYPSALSAEEFLLANASTLDGTIYLWSHNSPPSDAYPGDAKYNYTTNDYATWNLTGGTATSAATEDPLTPGIFLRNTQVPTGYIASGQSFFVKSNQAGMAQFNNAMRVSGSNEQFYKVQPPHKQPSRYWLNIRNNQGAFNQILIAYLKEATYGLDWGYDGNVFGGNYLTLYTVCEETNLSIQARPLPFHDIDIVNLGFDSTIAGPLSITLENVEGVFATAQSIYIKDNLTPNFHNLKDGPYHFTTAIGSFPGRFELHYRADHLNKTSVKDITDESQQIIAFKNASDIIVEAKDCTIAEIEILDLQGKTLKTIQNLNTDQTTVNGLAETQQVLILKVKTTEGKLIIKRLIY